MQNGFLSADRPAKVIRDSVEHCTGDGGISVEDDRDYCVGWVPIVGSSDDDQCTQIEEYR